MFWCELCGREVQGKNKSKASENRNNNSKNDKKTNCNWYGYNKKRRYIKDSNLVKKLKKDASAAKVNLVESENHQFITMVIGVKDLHIGMVTEVHMTATNVVRWWMDSGAILYIAMLGTFQ